MGRRALVLGGGGSAGNAWLVGVVAGLLDAGLDVLAIDVAIGTSAGATTAAQLADRDPARLFAEVLDARPPAGSAPVRPERGRPAATPGADPMQRVRAISAASSGPADMRRRMGAAALELAAGSTEDHSARWRAVVAARLPGPAWPLLELRVTAVDASTGEPVVFDRSSGIDLVDAVAASTSSRLPFRIGARQYIDGGYRRNENADLATGYERVLVLSPLGGRTLHPPQWGMQLAAQVDDLRAAGSRVETVLPDPDSLSAFGSNLMDPATRPPAAHAGYEQGRALAGRLGAFWG